MNIINLTRETVMPADNDYSLQENNQYLSLEGAEYDEGRTSFRHYAKYYKRPLDRDKYTEAAVERSARAFNSKFN